MLLYTAVENHGGGDCDAINPRRGTSNFLANSGFWCLFVMFVLTRFTCGNRGKFHMSWFQLGRAPEGRTYVLFLRMMRTEDRYFVWFCISCNGMADSASLFVEIREFISCD